MLFIAVEKHALTRCCQYRIISMQQKDMTKDKEVFFLVIFDIIVLLWAIISIQVGFDDMYEMRNPYQTILLIISLLVGISLVYWKIKNPNVSFKVYNLWIPFFVLLWLAWEFITFAHYNTPSSEILPRLIKSIYFEGLINLLYPFLFSYIIIVAYAVFSFAKQRLAN